MCTYVCMNVAFEGEKSESVCLLPSSGLLVFLYSFLSFFFSPPLAVSSHSPCDSLVNVCFLQKYTSVNSRCGVVQLGICLFEVEREKKSLSFTQSALSLFFSFPLLQFTCMEGAKGREGIFE